MKFRTLFFLVFPLLIIFSFLITPLDSDWWINNGKLFLDALMQHDFKGTYLSSLAQMHPGLSIDWISALIQFLLPASLQNLSVHLHNLVFSTFLVSCLFLGLKFLSKNFSKEALMLSAVYIALLPNLILFPRSTYLDWVVAGALFLSTALWIDYLNYRRTSTIVWIGILFGIAILTKYSAAFLLPGFFIAALIKGNPDKNLIKPLTIIVLVASTIFIIFFPALWVNPGYVLSNLFDKKEGIFNLSINTTTVVQVWEQLLRVSLKLNPMVLIGSVLTVICLFKRTTKKEMLLPAIVGLTYLILLIVSLHIIFLRGSDPLNFVAPIERYTFPVTMLFTVTFFEVIYQNEKLKKAYLLRNSLIILLFLYEIMMIAHYIILTYTLS